MHPGRWQQIDQLFHSALGQEPNRRAAFLVRECAGDESLRSEVEALISSHEQAESFIETPASDLAAELLAKGQTGLTAGQAVGPYRVVSVLGVGGMGEVYLAQDTRLGRQVALKLLPPQFTMNADRVRRFEQEARAVSTLNHPNIVTIHEIGRDDGSQFIVTEFVQGQTLRQRMAETAISLPAALEVGSQVASALGAAHAAGIVHRDIKPENIMLRADGYVKVLDFGLAKLTERKTPTSDTAATLAKVQTKSGLVMGTVTYMSPEQARGLAVDARSDIFSLGIVIYQMLAGSVPFDGATTSDVIVSILEREPIPLRQFSSEIPIELEWMIKKALAKDREQRYQTIKELQIDLKRLKQELDLQAKLDGLAPGSSRDRAMAARSGGNLTAQVTHVSSEATLARTTAGLSDIKDRKRGLVPATGTLVAAIVVIAIFSGISFYVGLKRVPPVSQPAIRQLTFRRGFTGAARFAPDGNTIIYSANLDGKPEELFTSRLGSPESSSLKAQVGGRVAGIQSISSSGEMAVLLDCELNWGVCHNGTLASMPLVGGTPKEILEDVFEADWSPNGKNLAIVHVVEGQYQLEYPIGR